MDESIARRRPAGPEPVRDAGFYETALRVIGRYVDEQKPRDVFLLRAGGRIRVRLFLGGQAGSHHSLAEFTRDDIAQLVTQGRPANPTPAPKATA